MISKRQLGIAFLAIGVIAVLAVLAIDWIGAGEYSGIGPAQKAALAAGGGIAVLGLSLIPLGDRPA
ncbi:MAG: hypothetical protein JXA42_03395 [Anaerolineales bacterium]|nr:hypothetical protein [Anaerolineales bacterium]